MAIQLTRDDLAEFIPTPRAIRAFEQNLIQTDQNATAIPIIAADAAAAQSTADGAQSAADTAIAATEAIADGTYLVLSPNAALNNERVFTPGNLLTVSIATPGVYNIAVNDTTLVKTTGTQTVTGKTFDILRTGQTASPSVATVTHSVPITLNGTTYYILLSSVP